MISLKNITDRRVEFPCLKSISIGRAYELLRADVREYLTKARAEIGFEYCRFHALFHDDMNVVYTKENGEIGYHWHHIDEIYDFLLSIGMKPFVELNPMPEALASGDATMFWYKMNVTPPKDMKQWSELVFNFVKHLSERYGNEEVSKWYFEVWNEPNLECFWTGTQKEYFELYRHSALSIKAVDNRFKVGGPATAIADWIGDTIEFCSDNDVPLDFITTHVYPMDEHCRYKDGASPYKPGEFYRTIVKGVYDTVKNSKMPDLKIYWTEYNTLSCNSSETIQFLGNPALDRLYAASCIVRNMTEAMGLCESISYWVVSDIFEEARMPLLPFSGTYGLLTVNGTKKAAYNAFLFMKKMRGRLIEVDCDAPVGAGIIAAEENGVYRLLLWNNIIPETKGRAPWKDKIKLNIERPDCYLAEEARIREGQGSAYEVWLKLGKPSNLSPFNEEILRAKSEPEYTFYNIEKSGEIEFSLGPDEVAYIEISARDYSNAEGGVKSSNPELEEKLKTY